MTKPDLDMDKAHRYFAVECNNKAWDLIEGPSLDPEGAERLVHLAHTSVFHWSHAGDELNALRGETLLVAAYLKARRPEPASHHGVISFRMLEQSKGRHTLFDAAMAHTLVAGAHRLAGRSEEASLCSERAASLLDQLESAGERDLIVSLEKLA
ncbi:MAG: hypothetical protein AAGB34_04265 [Planctomycetota bacterium]